MAESTILVPDTGTKKIHTFNRTIGANAVEDEVVVNGEQYLASYSVATIGSVSSCATVNSHLLQIMAGASLKVRIRRIEMYQSGLATAAAIMNVGVYRLSSAGTGGVAHAVGPLDTTDAAAGATAMTIPTAKGTEVLAIANGAAYMLQTVGASTQLVQPTLVWDFDRPRSKPLIIQAGATNGIAVKNLTAVANASVFFMVWLDETSFA